MSARPPLLCLTTFTFLLQVAPALAQPASAVGAVTVTAPVRIGAPPPASGPCITLEVAGQRAGDAACAADKLDVAAKAAAAAAQGAAVADPTLAVPGARSADTVVGVTSATAVSQQFGASFGKSVIPQRSPPPPPAPSPFTRIP